jgi:diacylglycerol kinase
MLNFLKSFVFALNGFVSLIKSERNFKIQCIIFSIVLFFSFYFKISKIELLLVLLCSGLVMGFEALNTSIEKLCDFVEPNKNEKIKLIKDISAAAVLIVSIFSGIIGVIIFWKYLI